MIHESLNTYTKHILEDEFFSKDINLSYSGLSKLLYSPALYYNHYILRQREDGTDKSLIEGKLLHCLLLTPERFNDEFVIAPTKKPSDRVAKIIEEVFKMHENLCKSSEDYDDSLNLRNYEDVLLEQLVEQDLYQKLKTDEARLKNLLKKENIEYFEFLKDRNKKTLIDQNTYDEISRGVEIVKMNGYVLELLGQTFTGLTPPKVFNELLLTSELPGYPFNLMGYVDNLVIDEFKKTVLLNDVKKTSKNLTEFQDSIEYYKYWLQAAIYIRLVKEFIKNNYSGDYTFEFRFIVVDKYAQSIPILIQESTLEEWDKKTEELLNKAKWHFDTKNFGLPWELATVKEMVL